MAAAFEQALLSASSALAAFATRSATATATTATTPTTAATRTLTALAIRRSTFGTRRSCDGIGRRSCADVGSHCAGAGVSARCQRYCGFRRFILLRGLLLPIAIATALSAVARTLFTAAIVVTAFASAPTAA
jgi:hypothetical protein